MLELNPLAPNQKIENSGNSFSNVADFWGWAFSALYAPIPRGYFAEYIVFKSIFDGNDNSFRLPMNYLSTKLEKDEPDLITYLGDDKMTIQVKSIDSIKSKQAFSLGKSHGYNPKTDKDDGDLAHHSDLFVLCLLELNREMHDQLNDYRLHGCKTLEEKQHCQQLQENLNNSVLEMNNWIFYVFPSTVMQGQNSITVAVLEKFVIESKVTKCRYSRLHSTIRSFHCLKVSGQKYL